MSCCVAWGRGDWEGCREKAEVLYARPCCDESSYAVSYHLILLMTGSPDPSPRTVDHCSPAGTVPVCYTDLALPDNEAELNGALGSDDASQTDWCVEIQMMAESDFADHNLG